jgi:hypothetical protein
LVVVVAAAAAAAAAVVVAVTSRMLMSIGGLQKSLRISTQAQFKLRASLRREQVSGKAGFCPTQTAPRLLNLKDQ